MASFKDHGSVVDVLLQSGADVKIGRNDGATALFIVSQEGYGSAIDALLQPGADFTIAMDDGETALFIAVENGHEAIVAAFIQAGANVNCSNTCTGHTALSTAIRKARADYSFEPIVSLLIQAGATCPDTDWD